MIIYTESYKYIPNSKKLKKKKKEIVRTNVKKWTKTLRKNAHPLEMKLFESLREIIDKHQRIYLRRTTDYCDYIIPSLTIRFKKKKIVRKLYIFIDTDCKYGMGKYEQQILKLRKGVLNDFLVFDIKRLDDDFDKVLKLILSRINEMS